MRQAVVWLWVILHTALTPRNALSYDSLVPSCMLNSLLAEQKTLRQHVMYRASTALAPL